MLRWSTIFIIMAGISAIFGFGEITPGVTAIAAALFFIFLDLFFLALIFGERVFNKK